LTDDRRVQVFDVLHVRLTVVPQETLHQGSESFVQLALRFGYDGVEDE